MPVPITVAAHCDVALVAMEVGAHATVTEVMVGVGAVTVTLAEPDLVVSWVLVAVMETGLVAGTAVGAVYSPADEMVPSVELPPATPPTAQVTEELKLPVPATVEVHCEVAPVATDVGLQATVTDVMVGAAGGLSVMAAEADVPGLALLVAVSVTVAEAAMEAGAV